MGSIPASRATFLNQSIDCAFDMFRSGLLQRYMPGDRALKLIADAGLYFRRIDCYRDDPTEGDRESFGAQEQRILATLNSALPAHLAVSELDGSRLASDWMHREKRNIFIQSWFNDRAMSRAMWDAYGGYARSPDCAAVVVDQTRLEACLDVVLPVGWRMGQVSYVANKSIQRDGVFTKGAGFDKEKEFRISIDLGALTFFNPEILPELTWSLRPSNAARPRDLGQHLRNHGVADHEHFHHVNGEGFILKLPLHEFVEAILIPKRASKDFCAKFDALLAAQGYGIRCERIAVPARDGD